MHLTPPLSFSSLPSLHNVSLSLKNQSLPHSPRQPPHETNVHSLHLHISSHANILCILLLFSSQSSSFNLHILFMSNHRLSPQPPDHAASETKRKPTGKRAPTAPMAVPAAPSEAAPPAPCGACKFLRRKCISGCIFAPHFGSDQGAARFAAVHKVFGASNVSKLLLHIPVNRRQDAVVTIAYEAQARLSDPVYGCVSTILALQQQVILDEYITHIVCVQNA